MSLGTNVTHENINGLHRYDVDGACVSLRRPVTLGQVNSRIERGMMKYIPEDKNRNRAFWLAL